MEKKLTTIEKLKAYFKSKKKFGDCGCFVITAEVEKAMGFGEDEMEAPEFWQRFISAVQDTYPNTGRDCEHYSFGEPQEEGITDEDNFSNWLEIQKHRAKTSGLSRILCLHRIPKFKEKILLRGLLATNRFHKLHVFIFEASFMDGVPFLVAQHCENGEHLQQLVKTPVAPPEIPAEVVPTLIDQAVIDRALENSDDDSVEESRAEAPEKEANFPDSPPVSEVPVEETDSQVVTEPLPEAPYKLTAEHAEQSQAKAPEKPEIINDMPRMNAKTRPTKNYLRDAYAGASNGFNTGVGKMPAFKVYDKKDAPANAIFVATKIERDGVVDLAVPSYDYLKPNEKLVHLYRMPDAR